MYMQAQANEITVPGTHITMMARPQVQQLAVTIRDSLPARVE